MARNLVFLIFFFNSVFHGLGNYTSYETHFYCNLALLILQLGSAEKRNLKK